MAISTESDPLDTARDLERRTDSRFPQDTEISVLFPKAKTADQDSETLARLPAVAQDISSREIRFQCAAKLTDESVLIEFRAWAVEYAVVRILHASKVADNVWEYGAAILRFVSEPNL